MNKSLLLIISLFISYAAASQSIFQQEEKTSSMCGPIPAVCTPGSINTSGGVGITFFSLSQINNTSTNSIGGGYQNFTCSDSTFLNQGGRYQIRVNTGQTYVETLRSWIDFNNDGSFDSTEVIYFDAGSVYTHVDSITIPILGQPGIALRLRLGSEEYTYPAPDGCSYVQYGQYEDYTVYLNGPTGLDNPERKNSVSVFPSPFHTTARLEMENENLKIGNCMLKIYNTIGILVREENILNINSYILHRNGLREGLYFYELQSTNHEHLSSGKFIVE